MQQSLIKAAGGNLSLITASLLPTALSATQPAGQVKRPSKQSVNQPACQLGMAWTCALLPACLLVQKKHTRHSLVHIYSGFELQ